MKRLKSSGAKSSWQKLNVRGAKSRRVASRRYRGHPPCRKVVRLARVPYYARPRLTPFLSVHVSLGSGSIRRALADVSPSLPSLGIKLANGRKKWSRDNARSLPVEVYSLAPPMQPSPLGHPAVDSPHFHVAVTLGRWHFYFYETCVLFVVVIVDVLYTRLLTTNDDAMLNKDRIHSRRRCSILHLLCFRYSRGGCQAAGEKMHAIGSDAEIYTSVSFVIHSTHRVESET